MCIWTQMNPLLIWIRPISKNMFPLRGQMLAKTRLKDRDLNETWLWFDCTVLIQIKFRDGRDQVLILSTFFPPNFRGKSQGTSPSLLRCWAQSGLLSCVRPLEMRRRRRRHRAKAGAGKPSGDSQVHNYWNSTRVCVSHPCVMFFLRKYPPEVMMKNWSVWHTDEFHFDAKSCSQVDSWYEIDPLLCQKNAQNLQGFASSILQVEAWTVTSCWTWGFASGISK